MRLRGRAKDSYKSARYVKNCNQELKKVQKSLRPHEVEVLDKNQPVEVSHLYFPFKSNYSSIVKPLIILCSKIDEKKEYPFKLLPNKSSTVAENGSHLRQLDSHQVKGQYEECYNAGIKTSFMDHLQLISKCFNQGTVCVHLVNNCMCIKPCYVKIQTVGLTTPISRNSMHASKLNDPTFPCFPSGKLLNIDLTSNLGNKLFGPKVSLSENNYNLTSYQWEKYCDYRIKEYLCGSPSSWPCTYTRPFNLISHGKFQSPCRTLNIKGRDLSMYLNGSQCNKRHRNIKSLFCKVPRVQLHKVIMSLSSNVSFVNLGDLIKQNQVSDIEKLRNNSLNSVNVTGVSVDRLVQINSNLVASVLPTFDV